MSAQEKEEVIDLQLDSDGVYKPVKTKTQRQKVQKPKQSKTQQRISMIAQGINDPQLQQFLYGVNTAIDIVERFKKAFR